MTLGEWPQKDLERVITCPVCACADRTLRFEGLRDRAFGVAPGSWTLWQCTYCASAYLDPRPTSDSIGRAYGGYYTHSADDYRFVRRQGKLRTLLHDMVNGYQNYHYGANWPHANAAGRWLLPLIPSLRAAAASECRHLPHVPPGGGSLLDIGCGNGGFLALARSCGWNVKGVDFDLSAVTAARTRGLDVCHGGVDVLNSSKEAFDVVTLSHVIEHVYDPLQVLHSINRLLKPGGVLWLETPNIQSLGAARFGMDWRGLEPPRHLVLFNWESLVYLLREAGFQSIAQRWRGMAVFDVFGASEAMVAGRLGVNGSYGGSPPFRAIQIELIEMLRYTKREFLTCLAWK